MSKRFNTSFTIFPFTFLCHLIYNTMIDTCAPVPAAPYED